MHHWEWNAERNEDRGERQSDADNEHDAELKYSTRMGEEQDEDHRTLLTLYCQGLPHWKLLAGMKMRVSLYENE
jgi:hypothetical protein